MIDNQNRIAGLMVKYVRRERLTEEEITLLEQWSSRSAEHREVKDQFNNPDWVWDNLKALPPVPIDGRWNALEQRIDESAPRRIVWRIVAVSVVVVILAIDGFRECIEGAECQALGHPLLELDSAAMISGMSEVGT